MAMIRPIVCPTHGDRTSWDAKASWWRCLDCGALWFRELQLCESWKANREETRGRNLPMPGTRRKESQGSPEVAKGGESA